MEGTLLKRKPVTTGGRRGTEHTHDPNGFRNHDTNIRDKFTSMCYK